MEKIKFLADVKVEKPLVDYLSKQGYDTKWVQDYNCEISDEDLLQLANEEKRIFITNDKDFGELVFLQKKLNVGTILFRIKGQNSQEKVRLLKKLLMGYRDKLLNHYVVITRLKIRIIHLGDVR